MPGDGKAPGSAYSDDAWTGDMLDPDFSGTLGVDTRTTFESHDLSSVEQQVHAAQGPSNMG